MKKLTLEERVRQLEERFARRRSPKNNHHREAFPALLLTQITAASYDEPSGTFTLGKGTAQPLRAIDDGSSGKEFEDVGNSIDVYSWFTEASKDPTTYDMVVWVSKSSKDGLYYQINEDCEPPEVY